ncbi:MAG: NADH-quinone oxidoreductase subunit L [Proteobacteria bacterium]|nr:NADH-quinone oxidoreductase subunit L [Pseudomonadota bacterium]
MNTLLLPVIIPALAALAIFLIPKKWPMREIFAVLVAVFNAIIAWYLFKKDMTLVFPWGGAWGMEFSFRLYGFSGFTLLATAFFALLIAIYSTSFMKDKEHVSQFYAYLLLILAQINGVVLSDNLILMLFFWEGMLLTMFGFIAIGGKKESIHTAVKAFIINGTTDLLMMAGIAITGYLAGTFTISQISLQTGGLASLAFILLIIGAISKAGSMPFHTWIPDAATDAPLPFMAFGPGSFEKLVGIYFLARICLNIFTLSPGSGLSTMLMIIGAITILAAVMMALVQKDYKKLLSYHAISQVGYMILGIGTALPIGIIGGLFHMLNNAIYKDCLFQTAGAVEKQTGTTDLYKLGGLASKMPVTFICFVIAALSISGTPFFNGFFSKELIYDGALESGMIFYLAAVVGSFFTAASFLKLGHAAYFGTPGESTHNVKKDVPLTMLVPMIVLAVLCIFFGVYNAYPLNAYFMPIIGAAANGHSFSGMPANFTLVIITILVLVLAYLNHKYGVKKFGAGIKAVDHIHHAPVLANIYNMAEKRYFDPYELGLKFVRIFSKASFSVDRGIDWIYNHLSVRATQVATNGIKKAHTGNFSMYIAWSLGGMIILVIWILRTVR